MIDVTIHIDNYKAPERRITPRDRWQGASGQHYDYPPVAVVELNTMLQLRSRSPEVMRRLADELAAAADDLEQRLAEMTPRPPTEPAMDPNACLLAWALAVLAEDREAANKHHEALRTWLARGGFEPTWEGPNTRGVRLPSRAQFLAYDQQSGRIGGTP